MKFDTQDFVACVIGLVLFLASINLFLLEKQTAEMLVFHLLLSFALFSSVFAEKHLQLNCIFLTISYLAMYWFIRNYLIVGEMLNLLDFQDAVLDVNLIAVIGFFTATGLLISSIIYYDKKTWGCCALALVLYMIISSMFATFSYFDQVLPDYSFDFSTLSVFSDFIIIFFQFYIVQSVVFTLFFSMMFFGSHAVHLKLIPSYNRNFNLLSSEQFSDVDSRNIVTNYNSYLLEKTEENNKDNDGKSYRKHFFTSLKGLKELRLKISEHFFELLRTSKIDPIDLVSLFKEDILKNKGFVKTISESEVEILQKMVKNDDFTKYFTDLSEIVRYLMNSVILHKKIGARPLISYISNALIKKGINLFQSGNTVFPKTIAEIYDYLQNKYSDFFPERGGSRKEYSDRLLIGLKIKLYVVQHIYNGLYFKDKKGQCPKCREQGFKLNRDLSRLMALEFHHSGDEKEYEYTAMKLANLFENSLGDLNFLENLIHKMESEHVELICNNHHTIYHSSYFNIFKHLINWDQIFTLDSIQIHLLIRLSARSYSIKRKCSRKEVKGMRNAIESFLKKRYILELLYDGVCPICREFNIRDHLPAFDFHHFDESRKSLEAAFLFRSDISCSDIVKKLEAERGGYICRNCHTTFVFERKDQEIINKLYDDDTFRKLVNEDIKRLQDQFKFLKYDPSIGNPLGKDSPLFDQNIDYLFAIYEIIKSGNEATNKTIANYLNVSEDSVRATMRNELFNDFLEIEQMGEKSQKKYKFNKKGEITIELMSHFRDYYSAL